MIEHSLKPARLAGLLLTLGLLGLAGCASQQAGGSGPEPSAAAAPGAENEAPAPSAESVAPTAQAATEPGDECGGASYYADKFVGRPTASGEPYSATRLRAAHKTLPFGTKVAVAMEGGGVVTVTINDRGPFVEGRIIDLSRAAAEEIGLVRAGVAPVCIKIIEA